MGINKEGGKVTHKKMSLESFIAADNWNSILLGHFGRVCKIHIRGRQGLSKLGQELTNILSSLDKALARTLWACSVHGSSTL